MSVLFSANNIVRDTLLSSAEGWEGWQPPCLSLGQETGTSPKSLHSELAHGSWPMVGRMKTFCPELLAPASKP